MHANQELEKEGAKQTPDVPGVSAGRPSCDDTSENHLLMGLRRPPLKAPPAHAPTEPLHAPFKAFPPGGRANISWVVGAKTVPNCSGGTAAVMPAGFVH